MASTGGVHVSVFDASLPKTSKQICFIDSLIGVKATHPAYARLGS